MSSNTNTDILVAGAFAAFAVDLLIYPLDTIKTRIQSPNYARTYLNTSTNTINRALLFRGVYQGIGSVVIATVPSSSRSLLHNLRSPQSPPHPPEHPFLLLLLLPQRQQPTHPAPPAPQPRLRNRRARLLRHPHPLRGPEAKRPDHPALSLPPPSSTHSPSHKPSTATLTALSNFRHHPRQLWTGYAALAARNLPFTAMQFPLFEHFRARTHASRQRRGVATGSVAENGVVTAVSAGSAGSIAAVVTTPIDVVKTRVMLGAGAGEGQGRGREEGRDAERGGRKAGRRGGGAVAVGREVLRTDGVRGLFRGGALRAVWTAVGMGLYLGVYESGRKWLEGRRERDAGEEGRGIV